MRSAFQITSEAERLGAQVSSGAGVETSSVRLSALKTNLTPSLALLADIIRNPSFTQADIDRVRTIWLAHIEQEQAEPVSLALRLLPPTIYGENSAYGVPLTGSGTTDSISALTRDDMVRFQRERTRPDNATFFVVGDISLAEATAALETAFRGWAAPSTARPALQAVAAPTRTGPRLILVDRPNSPQKLILAGRATTGANAADVIAQEVMNDTLGELFSARVNMNLRERKGWSYGSYTFFQNARGPRPWLIYAPVQTEKTRDAIVELRRELAEITGRRPITDEEFERAHVQNIRSLPGSFETASNVLGALTSSYVNGRALDWTPSLPGRYRALTIAEAQNSAREIVRSDDLVWVVVGDRAQVEAGIRSLNIAPLEIWDVNGRPVQ